MKKIFLKQIAVLVPFALILWTSDHLEKILGPPRKRGIDCLDSSIKQPFVADTIHWKTLYVIGLYFPLIFISTHEILHTLLAKRRGFQGLKDYLVNVYLSGMPFFCGFASERFLKNLLKFTVSRLRPHAYTLCQPVTVGGLTCNQLPAEAAYMSEYSCSEELKSTSIYKSFPSGHSSLAFYGMIYVALYLQRCKRNIAGNQGFVATIYRPLVILMQLSGVSVAAMVAICRVFDFKHFWSDIAAGALLGTLVALAFSYYAEENQREVTRVLQKKSEKVRDHNIAGKLEQSTDIGMTVTKNACSIDINDAVDV
ncbi:phospholipid phosphatase 1-like [Musca autumnalis]|uniref:phospholipid phosphatase 1-like n=1 Tax=Musca autumnalis TaxID=221902 RepID=UPI003CED6A4B